MRRPIPYKYINLTDFPNVRNSRISEKDIKIVQ